MFQFKFLGVTIVFTLQSSPNILEANLKFTFPLYVEIEIRRSVPFGGEYGTRVGAEHMV